MNRAMLEDHLAATERQLAEAERHVAYQRELVAQMERDGYDTAQATRLLEQFEEVLAMHIADRDRVRKELGL
jgi:hypothetical protein